MFPESYDTRTEKGEAECYSSKMSQLPNHDPFKFLLDKRGIIEKDL